MPRIRIKFIRDNALTYIQMQVKVSGCSGNYELRALINNIWTVLGSPSGMPTDGGFRLPPFEIDGVDLVIGNTYLFRVSDSNGVYSNNQAITLSNTTSAALSNVVDNGNGTKTCQVEIVQGYTNEKQYMNGDLNYWDTTTDVRPHDISVAWQNVPVGNKIMISTEDVDGNEVRSNVETL